MSMNMISNLPTKLLPLLNPQISVAKQVLRTYCINTMGNILQRSQIDTVDVHAANDLLRSGHHYLDVRTEEEFQSGHVDVEKCLNIPYFFFTPQGKVKNTKFLEQVSSVCSKDDPIVVGCQSGVRSSYATTDLVEAGFKQVKNMGGGYSSWAKNKLSVKESKGEL